MKPACSVPLENLLPIDFAGLQLRDSGVATVRTSERGAQTEASLSEIQAVADGPADTVEIHPAHIFLTNTSLEHEVFDESPN